jgi:hypothetical protein
MEKYGKIFDQTFNSRKDKVYYLINEYYDNPNVKKIKDDKDESIYMACNQTQLLTNNQFIICTCIIDSYPIGSVRPLKHLKWVAFQTRMLDENKSNHIKFSYTVKNTENFKSKLSLLDRDEFITRYICKKYNIIISLLHENAHKFEYPDGGILNQALESYKTIITFM